MFKKLLLVAWVCVALFLVNCKGDDGAVGPKGDTGAAGPAGPAGPAGADGESDTTGSGGALIYSFGADTTDADGYFPPVSVPNLTAAQEEIWNSAVIMVYLKSTGVYWPLPGVVGFTSASSQFTFVHGIQDSTFFVDTFQTNWSETSETPPTRIIQDFRLIIIPGTVMRQNANINLKNYDEVVASLGLQEKDVKIIKNSR